MYIEDRWFGQLKHFITHALIQRLHALLSGLIKSNIEYIEYIEREIGTTRER